MSVFLRPRNTRVAIRRDESEGMSAGLHGVSIVLPDQAKDKPQKGTVLACGPRCTADLNPGDAVLITKFAGDAFRIEGEDVLVVDQKDIIAVVTEPEPAPSPADRGHGWEYTGGD